LNFCKFNKALPISGGDSGIDRLNYCKPDGKKTERVVVSVKSAKKPNILGFDPPIGFKKAQSNRKAPRINYFEFARA
jgi:hypothetical protein